MEFKFKNGRVRTEEHSLGEGSNFVSYRARLFNDTYPRGKTVIFKVFMPIDYQLRRVNENGLVCRLELLPAQSKSLFLTKYKRMESAFDQLKELYENTELRDYIVDLYDVDNALFDERNNELAPNDETTVQSLSGYRGFSIYYDDNFNNGESYQNYSDFCFDSIIDILEIVIRVSKVIDLLHKNGFL